MTEISSFISRHIFAKLVEFYFHTYGFFLWKETLSYINMLWKIISNYFYVKIDKLYHKFIDNIKIQQIAKIKILQIITKSSTTFTNMNLKTWKRNFEHKIRYGEQCFTLPFLGIFWYKKVLFLKSNFFTLYRCVRKWKIQKYCHYFCFYDFALL